MNTVDPQATALTRARYDRNARLYDRMTRGSERVMNPGRAALRKRVSGPRVLEVGVGTGKSMPYYPARMTITAIDLSPRILEQARMHAARDHIVMDLREADVQALPFPDASFDTAIATCVFCSVPDPVLGLRELRRVLVPGGQLLLLEHVLSHRPLLRSAMELANPLVVRMVGANINRETIEAVTATAFFDPFTPSPVGEDVTDRSRGGSDESSCTDMRCDDATPAYGNGSDHGSIQRDWRSVCPPPGVSRL